MKHYKFIDGVLYYKQGKQYEWWERPSHILISDIYELRTLFEHVEPETEDEAIARKLDMATQPFVDE